MGGSSTYSMSESSSHALTFSTLAFFAGCVPPVTFVFSVAGNALRFRVLLFAGEAAVVPFRVCFANMAWMPSLRSARGSMNVGDSVPIFPTSLGTA